MTKSNWKHYFDKKAETHGASVKSSDYFDEKSFFIQRDNIIKWLGEVKGKEILDAGCGVGAFSEPLTSHNVVYGVDFSAKSLEFAAARGLHTVVGDLTSLAFEDNKFDVVLCIGVIQLIEHHMSVIDELTRITKPGGTLLVQTLHKGSIQRKILGLFEQSKKFDKMYSMDELKNAFVLQGFTKVQFLKMYHPFSFVTRGEAGMISDMLCTSFAIKGVKRIECLKTK